MFFLKRLFFKYIGNVCSGLVKIIPDFIFASLIGISSYGSLAFIRDTSSSLIKVFDLNVSEAFYHFSSKEKKDNKIVIFQIYWLLILSSLYAIFLLIMLLPTIKNI